MFPSISAGMPSRHHPPPGGRGHRSLQPARADHRDCRGGQLRGRRSGHISRFDELLQRPESKKIADLHRCGSARAICCRPGCRKRHPGRYPQMELILLEMEQTSLTATAISKPTSSSTLPWRRHQEQRLHPAIELHRRPAARARRLAISTPERGAFQRLSPRILEAVKKRMRKKPVTPCACTCSRRSRIQRFADDKVESLIKHSGGRIVEIDRETLLEMYRGWCASGSLSWLPWTIQAGQVKGAIHTYIGQRLPGGRVHGPAHR